MDGAIEALRREFTGLRTGRASTALLENVSVDAYGSKMPMNGTGLHPFTILLLLSPRLDSAMLLQNWAIPWLNLRLCSKSSSDISVSAASFPSLPINSPAEHNDNKSKFFSAIHWAIARSNICIFLSRKRAGDYKFNLKFANFVVLLFLNKLLVWIVQKTTI